MKVVVQLGQGEELTQPLMVSFVVHLVMVALLLFSPAPGRGDAWGSTGGGAVRVSLVGNLQGIPLPRPDVVTSSRVATESPGLFREEPEPVTPGKAAEPGTSAGDIPTFEESRRRSQRDAIPPAPGRGKAAPKPRGAIPLGEGGPPSLPYSNFTAQAGEGGAAFGAGNSFSGRYAWYVEGARRRISSNWLGAAVDPYVQWAPRVIVTFDILRDGSVVSVEVTQSSGIPSVDRSALRAIRESSPLERLPTDYSGDRVSVEFFFDFRRK